MSTPEDLQITKIDRLLESYLDRQAAEIDVANVRSRLEPMLAASANVDTAVPKVARERVESATRRRSNVAWALATTLALALAFWGGRYVGPASANAATVLRSAKEVHSRPIDRCYQVHYVPGDRYWDGVNTLLGPSQSILWTRGDRFQSDSTIGDHHFVIGRDSDRRLWISSSPKKGLILSDESERLPKNLETLCAINSMSLPSLMDDVLADFDTRAEDRLLSNGKPVTIIWANPKPNRTHPLISAAVLEIDTKSKTISRLVIWLLRDERPHGTVTFTLTDQGQRDDETYQLKSYLDQDADIEIHRLAD